MARSGKNIAEAIQLAQAEIDTQNTILEQIKTELSTKSGSGGSYKGSTMTITRISNEEYNDDAIVDVYYSDGTSEAIFLTTSSPSVTKNNVIAASNRVFSVLESNLSGAIRVRTASTAGALDDSKYLYKVAVPIESISNIEVLSLQCLTGDTLIHMYNGSTQRIDSLQVGDKILSFNPITMKLEEDEIIYSDSNENKTFTEWYNWKFENDYEVHTVHPHRFYNVEKQKMMYINEWNIGDRAYTIDGEKVALLSAECIKDTINHYTIFTKNQNYFANGLLSGNRYTKVLNF